MTSGTFTFTASMKIDRTAWQRLKREIHKAARVPRRIPLGRLAGRCAFALPRGWRKRRFVMRVSRKGSMSTTSITAGALWAAMNRLVRSGRRAS